VIHTAEKGWIHRFAFEDEALSAETVGRAAMQDSYITNAKINNGEITAGKLAPKAAAAGYYGISTYGNCYYG